MSQRGSFISEYVYCSKCFEKLKKVLLDNEKYCTSLVIPSSFPNDEDLNIIAGKVGSTWSGGEVFEIEERLAAIEPGLCHAMTIVVIPEDESPVTIVVGIDGKVNKYFRIKG